MSLAIKRIYAAAEPGDGTRILVDRLWPRGISRAEAGIDEWMKDIAPSQALRQWFGHRPERWDEFRKRYRSELDGQAEKVERLRKLAARHHVTLLYAAHDEEHNNASALRDHLAEGRA
jgi:uncharacterized protein YeaO (DUF488 family)